MTNPILKNPKIKKQREKHLVYISLQIVYWTRTSHTFSSSAPYADSS